MRTEYPDVDMRFHFSQRRPVSPAPPTSKRTRPPIFTMGERIAGIVRRALPI
jgi:hypothetical protein